MQYIELSIAVPAAQSEAAAEALRAATGAGIAIDLPFSQPDLESDAQTRAGGLAHVRAYVPHTANVVALRSATAMALAASGIAAEAVIGRVDEEDWAEAWKEHFHVERFGPIVVVPSWRSYDAAPGDVVLTLDPGMAFGTGQHETTRMCLEALAEHVRPGARVLDAGCGSGILSIAAAKLGSASVLAVDVDADCVRITGDNARANAVGDRVHASVVAPSDDSWAAERTFDLIVGNIIAATIVELIPAFRRALVPNGMLIASGIIRAREQQVREALAAGGFAVGDVRTMGEWCCIWASAAGDAG